MIIFPLNFQSSLKVCINRYSYYLANPTNLRYLYLPLCHKQSFYIAYMFNSLLSCCLNCLPVYMLFLILLIIFPLFTRVAKLFLSLFCEGVVKTFSVVVSFGLSFGLSFNVTFFFKIFIIP